MDDTQQSTQSNVQGIEKENTFKILIATDIHLGYDESNAETGRDSFNAFEEILQLANSREVDFILLAGDLFHKAQPSSTSMNTCIQLLRTYTMGYKQIQFDITDTESGEEIIPKVDESTQSNKSQIATTGPLNYEDQNYNISCPVFTIHGNHDDVVNNLSAIDILSSSGLVNYFGKWENLDSIELKPIIFTKGLTKIALYGLSHIPDRRLFNLFQTGKVHAHFAGDVNDLNKNFFNILALHQNRAERGRNNTIQPDMLPGFMNFVIWGHEHDCRIEPEQFNNMYICQPGSSVATSLSEGESIEKKVGILEVRYNPLLKSEDKYEFSMTPINLKSVRPFIFRSIDIDDFKEEFDVRTPNVSDQVEKVLSKIVLEMIKEAKKRITNHDLQGKKPLLRLRVSYHNVDYLINPRRFGQRFCAFVAKCDELLAFKKNIHRLKVEKPDIDEDLLDKVHVPSMDRVEDYVNDYFEKLEDEKEKLALFDFKCLTEVVRLLTDKEDLAGAESTIQAQADAAIDYFKTNICRTEDLKELSWNFREQKSNEVYESAVVGKMSTKMEPPPSTPLKAANSDDSDDDDEMVAKSTKKSKKVSPLKDDISSSDDDDIDKSNVRASAKRQIKPAAAAPAKRGRGSRGGRTTAVASTSTRAKSTAGRGRAKKDIISLADQVSQSRSRRSAAVTSTQKDSIAFIITSGEEESDE